MPSTSLRHYVINHFRLFTKNCIIVLPFVLVMHRDYYLSYLACYNSIIIVFIPVYTHQYSYIHTEPLR